MKIAVLGTGIVGQAHASKLVELGHDVAMGTHDVQKKRADTEPGRMSQPPFADWIKANPKVQLATLADAVQHGEVIIEALKGEAVVEELKSLSSGLDGKLLVEISNALDFSTSPPSFFVCNNNSLGEQIQGALPNTKVVKAFNTMNANVQVEPQKLAGGDHQLFIAGNDADAKAKVSELAKSYGWQNILDLGDIKSARGMEMIMPLWLEIMGVLKMTAYNFKIAR